MATRVIARAIKAPAKWQMVRGKSAGRPRIPAVLTRPHCFPWAAGCWKRVRPAKLRASSAWPPKRRPTIGPFSKDSRRPTTSAAQYLPALKVYDRLIELDAATAATWCATGNALADLGEYAQAIGAYENSLKQDDASPEAHHNLARVLYRLGEVERAVHHLEYAADRCEAIAPWVSLATVIPGSPGADLATNPRGAH